MVCWRETRSRESTHGRPGWESLTSDSRSHLASWRFVLVEDAPDLHKNLRISLARPLVIAFCCFTGQKLNWMCDRKAAITLGCRMTLKPDPHGQAALMLCESLAFLFIEQGILGKHQIIDAVESIIESKQEIAEANEPIVISTASIFLLQAILRSISAASQSKSRF